jgi:hypothetical protein
MSSLPKPLLLLFLAFMIAVSGCSIPEGDQSSPSQLHYLWIKVRAGGEADQMWELLHPETRKEFETWLAAEKAVVAEIKAAYPAEDATTAVKAMGGIERGELESARALFVKTITPSPTTPGTLGAVGARVRSEDLSEDGNSASIRTFGGDEVVFKKGPEDKWYVTLQSDELVRLRNARGRAEENLKRVKANLQKLGRNKP